MTINIAAIGYGYWGPNLTNKFAKIPDYKLSHICEHRAERRQIASELYDNAVICADFAQVLKNKQVDAVYIATPAKTHYSMTLQALKAGKHVLVEKPMALSVEECETVIEESRKRNLIVMVDHLCPYTNAVRKLRSECQSGNLGNLMYFDSRRINLGMFQFDVNALWDLAVHDLSILNELIDLRPNAVSASGVAHFANHPINTAYMTLFYDAPFIAHIHVSWVAPIKLRMTMVAGSEKMALYDDTMADEKIRIYDKGVGLHSILKDSSDPKSESRRFIYRTGDLLVPRLEPNDALHDLAKHFLDVIHGRDTPKTGTQSGIEIIRVLEQAEQSIYSDSRKLKL